MKHFLIFLLALFVVVSGCVGLQRGFSGDGEVFEGTAQGYRGPVTVQVTLNDGFITEISIIESAEDRQVGAAAMEELLDLVIFYNSTDIDVISGATESSRGFFEAVQNAILKR